MTTFADVLGWTLSRADVSRCEETRWLGRHGDPADIPARGWAQRDEPTDTEEREAA